MADERFTRKISAILSADVAGYSRLMAEDAETITRTIKFYRKIVSSIVERHNGHVTDSPYDNLRSEFGNVMDAVQCAVEIHNATKTKGTVLGIHTGLTIC